MFNISVIIPTYNRASTLPRAIDSVLEQSYPANEIIVIDDGSNDQTQDLVNKHYATVKYLHQSNRGVSAARNIGIEHAEHDWICLLDSDDSWHSEKLEKQVNALGNKPEFLIAHTNETWYRQGKVLNQGKRHKKYGGHIFQHCLPLCAISPSSVMIHRKIFDQIGLFDESLPACEDYDMWLRICCRYPVLFLDEALTNKYGGHEDQLSRQHWGMDRFRIIALNKAIESGYLNNADRLAAVNMMLEKINIFLKGAEKHGGNDYSSEFNALLKKYA